ncbi:hypothetical protein HKX48_000108 [Thoreauomyces humboldtii]|nr:hypothetical protein HKX48_000108 [Thoreauomyces humboldtii]
MRGATSTTSGELTAQRFDGPLAYPVGRMLSITVKRETMAEEIYAFYNERLDQGSALEVNDSTCIYANSCQAELKVAVQDEEGKDYGGIRREAFQAAISWAFGTKSAWMDAQDRTTVLPSGGDGANGACDRGEFGTLGRLMQASYINGGPLPDLFNSFLIRYAQPDSAKPSMEDVLTYSKELSNVLQRILSPGLLDITEGGLPTDDVKATVYAQCLRYGALHINEAGITKMTGLTLLSRSMRNHQLDSLVGLRAGFNENGFADRIFVRLKPSELESLFSASKYSSTDVAATIKLTPLPSHATRTVMIWQRQQFQLFVKSLDLLTSQNLGNLVQFWTGSRRLPNKGAMTIRFVAFSPSDSSDSDPDPKKKRKTPWPTASTCSMSLVFHGEFVDAEGMALVWQKLFEVQTPVGFGFI